MFVMINSRMDKKDVRKKKTITLMILFLRWMEWWGEWNKFMLEFFGLRHINWSQRIWWCCSHESDDIKWIWKSMWRKMTILILILVWLIILNSLYKAIVKFLVIMNNFMNPESIFSHVLDLTIYDLLWVIFILYIILNACTCLWL